ncbi:glycoside hydrolase family 3 N-terminal domain-containing protein [Devriesea agamarum]|uniref:glycoside hydrolase family 3 N-terminal domain-containing protein n=1 Tax=Devriesea agamarum TaxID=472569 RepID=UPI00071D5A99|nr:glycoside hydrolase family 3 N-terminal domain-containing protein [Devriesea agamarum]
MRKTLEKLSTVLPHLGGLLAQDTSLPVQGDRKIDPHLAALCRRAAADGIVLLRHDETLPIAGRRIALFGRCQIDYFTVGYGSGGDVHAAYTTDLLTALQADQQTADLQPEPAANPPAAADPPTDRGNHGDINANTVITDSPASRPIIDKHLAGMYSTWCAHNPPDHGTWGHWPRHYPEMPLSSDEIHAAAQRSEAAIVIIGRAAGEDRDNVLEPGSFYLTDDERQLLDQVTNAFERTILVLNCGNIIDLSFLTDYGTRIGTVVYAWQGGMESGRALADVLTGRVTPSGKLPDTIACSYRDYPSSTNFGGKDANNYAEDIFVGYRYFETFARDRVMFPFGFGLSYTSFTITGELSEPRTEPPTTVNLLSPAQATPSPDDVVTVRATVTNTGDTFSGRDVAQLYVRAPQGVLGKPTRQLVSFAKTDTLAPGASQSLQLTVPLRNLASYDDAGGTGHRNAWVLEAGSYEFFLGSDVRSATCIGSISIPELIVTEQVEEAAAVAPEHRFARLTARPGATDTADPIPIYAPVPVRTVDLTQRILNDLPADIPLTGNRHLTADDVRGGRASLDAFLAQLSPDELEALTRGDNIMNSPLGTPGNAGVLGGVSPALRARGVDPITATDGPSGLRLAAYASLLPCGTALASTWDTTLVQDLANAHGHEMRAKGSQLLLSPGMNIHRDPLCGRNFEYFSEDPLVSGKMASAIVTGVQSNGLAACPKHFAANNQEFRRTHNDSRVSERALREIYLRGFEICVRQAQPKTIMTSYNKINGVWGHYHYELVTTILRKQWGYQGLVITDWWMRPAQDPHFPGLTNNAYRVRAGVDVLMPGSSGPTRKQADRSLLSSYRSPHGITLGEIQSSARRVLQFVFDARGGDDHGDDQRKLR